MKVAVKKEGCRESPVERLRRNMVLVDDDGDAIFCRRRAAWREAIVALRRDKIIVAQEKCHPKLCCRSSVVMLAS